MLYRLLRGVSPGLALALVGCASMETRVVDSVVSSAYRPPVLPASPSPPAPSYELLAGDLHCHVGPPDWAPHVVRGLEETAALAAQEGLDFVILTPHVWSRFFQDEGLRRRVLAGQADLRAGVAALPAGRTSFVVGFEYTDGQYGHVGVSFGDLEGTLAGLSVPESIEHPEKFFERYAASGGLLIVNHPFTTPTDFFVPIARADLSWRPFTAPRETFPAEIAAVHRLAQGFEAFNLTTTELRDRFLFFDRRRSIRQTLERLDQEIVVARRPLFPVGGSDSHGHSLRATTFVLSAGRAPEQIREALVAGRVCIRGAGACTFQARAGGGAWVPVGTSLREAASVELRAQGQRVEFFRNGASLGRGDGGRPLSASLPPGECSVLRASVDEGDSAPIYANCPF